MMVSIWNIFCYLGRFLEVRGIKDVLDEKKSVDPNFVNSVVERSSC